MHKDPLRFCVSPKYDGMSLNLIYKDGRLHSAITRGDGQKGELVTANALMVGGIPHEINFKGEIEIRGEVVISKKNFSLLNEERKAKGLDEFANARNVASGSMKQLDQSLVMQRHLEFVPWGVGYFNFKEVMEFLDSLGAHRVEKTTRKTKYTEPISWGAGHLKGDTLEESTLYIRNNSSKLKNQSLYVLLSVLPELGFRRVDHLKLVVNYGMELEDAYRNALSQRNEDPYIMYAEVGGEDKISEKQCEMDFWLDGFVIVLDDLALHAKLGYTQRAPRFACAYKFPHNETTVVIESITWQVGRSGILTPVANFAKTRLEGVEISRATLHNISEIRRLDLKIGDTCTLIRSGEVIPKLTGVLKQRREGHEIDIEMPTECPICAGALRVEDQGQSHLLYCENKQCSLNSYLAYAVSKRALNIDGLGKKILDLLVDSGLVSRLSDLYTLGMDSLLGLPHFKDKKASNLLAAIQDSRGKTPLWRLICALGIPHIGEVASKKLATFGIACFELPPEDLLAIDGFGDELVASFVAYSAKHKDEINRLIEIIRPVCESAGADSKTLESPGDSPFSGKTCVITGAFSIDRHRLKEVLEGLGAKVASSVNAKTDFLLVGRAKQAQSTKLKDAQGLGIKLLSEEDLLGLLPLGLLDS